MLEWLKRHAWKACIRQKRIGGSNPPLSAKKSRKSKDLQDSFIIILPCPSKITFTTNSVVLYIFYIISYKPSATICLWYIHSLILYKKAMKLDSAQHNSLEILHYSEGWDDGCANVCITFSTHFPFSLLSRNVKIHIFAVEKRHKERGLSWFSIMCRTCSTNLKRSISINHAIIP